MVVFNKEYNMGTDYEILKKICQNRKSTRKFSNREIAREDIDKIISLAQNSPYASGLKNWDIQVITDIEMIKQIAQSVRQKVTEWESEIRDDFREHFVNYANNFTLFESAPVLFVLNFRVSPVMAHMFGNNINNDILTWERDNFTKSISCVAMLILLAAESLGLGACYMTGPLIAQDKIKPLIKTKPGREIGAIIPVGYKI
jgi:nitroreductase